MTSSKATRPEIHALTGIRGLAAVWVVLYHLRERILPAFPHLSVVIDPLIEPGYLGVDLFFILSGFIISYNYAERFSTFRFSTYREFLWMRVARLWPVHFAVLLSLAVPAAMAARRGIFPEHREFYSGKALIENLLLIHGWSVPIRLSWNTPAWSISCEWLAYLLFPLLPALRLTTASIRRSVIVAASALLAMAIVCQWFHATANADFGIIRVAGEFTAGCGLCHLFQRQVAKDWAWRPLVSGAFAGTILLSHFILPPLGLTAYWSIPLLVLVIFGLAQQREAVSRILSSRPCLFGGAISYSLYMVHEPCFIVLQRLFPRLHARAFSFALELFVALASAVAMHYAVEKPCRNWMRKLFPGHQMRADAVR